MCVSQHVCKAVSFFINIKRDINSNLNSKLRIKRRKSHVYFEKKKKSILFYYCYQKRVSPIVHWNIRADLNLHVFIFISNRLLVDRLTNVYKYERCCDTTFNIVQTLCSNSSNDQTSCRRQQKTKTHTQNFAF